MNLRTSCTIKFEIPDPTPFILMLRPRSGGQQWVEREEFKITPHTPVFEFSDTYGNLCQRLIAQPGLFSIHTSSDVIISDYMDQGFDAPFVEIQNLPDSVLSYLLPSRYCESDFFYEMSLSITQGQLLGYNQVAAITDWLRENISYIPGSNNQPLSAIQVNERKFGVCTDLAHLGIALCRGLSIPARIVVGYLHKLKPMDMHAWFEAYIGNRWYTFDATQTGSPSGYVMLGVGRDAADVAIFNQFGPPVYPFEQLIQVEQLSF
ncbi:Transglutaminase-like enzyme, putative cysteine protease [Algoriphagus locisalis]|uniref:Transglutaminase-like enzyme, putative cysteine protease n=1 Tax=Algoriphagus locisalis TaxID=305507 RepID=A0A1I7BE39_9BACT|nr:transglutaminase family protein [Algoriphagus locisalis]SFT85362.1 Transglutaminase-like enzyme, putative cysteine protease [Algoriphagus locisalis]